MSQLDAAREQARRDDGRFGTQHRAEVHTDLVTPGLAEKRAAYAVTEAWAGVQLAEVDLRIATENVEAVRAGRNWPWKNARLRSAQARLDEAVSRCSSAGASYDEALGRTPDRVDLTPDEAAHYEVSQAASKAARSRMLLTDAMNDETYAVERADEKLAARRVKHLSDVAAAARREEDRVREIHGMPEEYQPQAVTDGIS